MSDEPALIYVWAGGALPDYAQQSMRLARQRYSGQVILVSEEPGKNHYDRWFDIRKLSNPLWEEFRETFSLDPLFRGGLWLRAYERFFVLDELCRRQGWERAFHAELDTIVLELDGFSSMLDRYGEALFLPMVNERTVVASLVYWNSSQSINDLCKFFTRQGGTQNEMNALSDYLHAPESRAFSFATEQAWDTSRWPYGAKAVSTDTGIVDAMAIGKWLFGQGPRTTQCTVWSKHRPNPSNSLPIDSIIFNSNIAGRGLKGKIVGEEWQKVRIIHLASKIHRAIGLPLAFVSLVWLSRLPIRLPLVPRLLCVQKRLIKSLLRRLRDPQHLLRRAYVGAISRQITSFTHRRGINLSDSERELLKSLSTPANASGRPLSLTYLLSAQGGEDSSSQISANSRPVAALGQSYLFGPSGTKSFRGVALEEMLRSGIERFGLNPDSNGKPLLRDVDVWPVLLSKVVDTEGILVTDNPDWMSDKNRMLSNREQVLFLEVQKKHWSRQTARFLLRIESDAPAWSCNPHKQIYRNSHLEKMFPNQEALLTWFNKARRANHESTLADYYGAWLLQQKGMRVKISF